MWSTTRLYAWSEAIYLEYRDMCNVSRLLHFIWFADDNKQLYSNSDPRKHWDSVENKHATLKLSIIKFKLKLKRNY